MTRQPSGTAAPAPGGQPASPGTPKDRSVGVFPHRSAVVSFMIAVLGSGATAPRCVRWPHDGPFWVVADLDPTLGAPLVELAGGQPYAVRPDGRLSKLRGHADFRSGAHLPTLSELGELPSLPVIELVLALPLRPVRVADHDEPVLVTAGKATRYAVRRCLAAGVVAAAAPVALRPSAAVADAGQGATVLALRVALTGERLPGALLEALADVPNTIVATPAGGGRRLLVQLGYRLPVPAVRVATLVPDGECWLVTADRGGWRVESRGPDVDAEELLRVYRQAADPAADPGPADLDPYREPPRPPAGPGPAGPYIEPNSADPRPRSADPRPNLAEARHSSADPWPGPAGTPAPPGPAGPLGPIRTGRPPAQPGPARPPSQTIPPGHAGLPSQAGPVYHGGSVDPAVRGDLLNRAAEKFAAGQLVAAAELLEQAGEYGRAGNLFRQAARHAPAEPPVPSPREAPDVPG